MKKINFIWLISCLMLLSTSSVSCSDDDEEGVGFITELVGTWERVSMTYQTKVDGIITDEGTDKTAIRITLCEGGTCKMSVYYNNEWIDMATVTWNYKNGKIILI